MTLKHGYMYDILQVEQNRNQHYVQSCGWFGVSYTGFFLAVAVSQELAG